jgi:DNA-binding MarR family transcriptional regulator
MIRTNPSPRLTGSVTHLLHRANQCATLLFEAEAGAKGLTATQFALLTAIAENEGVSQMGLVQRTGIDRSTVANVARRMVGKGLIQRKRVRSDARTYAVGLTEKGRRALEDALAGAAKADQRLLGGLSSVERRQLLATLDAQIKALES